MLRLVCKYDAKIVFKHMRVLCGKNCISGIPGNDFGEEFVAPQKAPIVYKLEAYGFQIGIIILNLNCQCLLLRGKPLDRRTYGVFGGLHLQKRRKKIFSMKFFIIGLEPELVYWISVTIQVPANTLLCNIQ